MIELLAQGYAGSGIVYYIIVAMVVAGAIGIAFVVAKQAGVVIPPFVITIGWILLAVIVGVIAIRILVSLL